MTIGKGLCMSLVLGLLWTLSASGADLLQVASFSTVLTEIAQQVGGDHLIVSGLVKPGQDPHEYQPTPDDLRRAASAKLILLSGKHLEHYLDKVQQAAGGREESLAVGDALPSLKMKVDPDEPQAKASANYCDPATFMKLPWRAGSGRISLAQIESSLERLATSMVATG
jgi:ABC-type Zn uptake system ZnuABC Zn-binding protein ZnuA